MWRNKTYVDEFATDCKTMAYLCLIFSVFISLRRLKIVFRFSSTLKFEGFKIISFVTVSWQQLLGRSSLNQNTITWHHHLLPQQQHMVLNRSHHGASNANSAKINSVTPIFLNFIQFYMKTGAIIESLKKFSGADFM